MQDKKMKEKPLSSERELSLEDLEEVSGGFSDINFSGLANPGLSMEEIIWQQGQNPERPKLEKPSLSAEEQARQEEAQRKLVEALMENAYAVGQGAMSLNGKPWK